MTLTAINATNGARIAIDNSRPYAVHVALTGVSDLLLHAWNCEAVAAKANASKGSKEKKQDNIESYMVRDDAGYICIPGTYIIGAMREAGRSYQDPRSPRKSLRDLIRAGITPITMLGQLNGGIKEWEFEHKCRHVVQRQGITRTYPAFKAGWRVSFDLQVNLPLYFSRDLVHALVSDAGKVGGFGDMRPTYGRFRVDSFEEVSLT